MEAQEFVVETALPIEDRWWCAPVAARRIEGLGFSDALAPELTGN